ncbi:uncharacterized protein LOC144422686 isoform X2 [Styela clava]
MNFVKLILFVSPICGLLANLKLPAGSCVSKIVNGKLVQVGDCEKDDGSDIVRLIKKSRDEKERAENKCDVTYKTKCFRAVVYGTDNVTFNDAEPICKSMNNGKPANIYDLALYQMLLPYLRSMIPAGLSYIRVWTGMEYKNNQLLLSSGGPITIATEVWRPTHPRTDASRTNVGISANKDPENEHQEMFNYSPSWFINGYLCEI